ncbi:MAG TPA: flagellar protein FliS [Gemmataceae bacterium]|nr:flagellar protein FliS [Gemmataceae bacterium]
MNPYKQYQSGPGQSPLRIDVILSLYEEAIERVQKTLVAAQRGDNAAVQKLLPPIHLIISALASAVEGHAGDLSMNLLRLFDFVVHCLKTPDPMHLEPALDVLRTLHEAFLAIRQEAVRLERSGEIVPLDRLRAVEVSA